MSTMLLVMALLMGPPEETEEPAKAPPRPRLTTVATDEEATPTPKESSERALLGQLRQLDKVKDGKTESSAFEIVMVVQSREHNLKFERYWLIFDADQDMALLNSKLTEYRSQWVRAKGRLCLDHSGKRYYLVREIEVASPDE